MNQDGKIALEVVGIYKRFPGVLANNNICFQVRAGEVHGLLGENGAGKTTLMNILYGLYQPDSGEIYINGEKVEIHSSKDAIEHGIGMVHQHFMLVDNLTTLENVVLGMPMERPPVLDLGPARKRFIELANEYSLDVDPDTPVWQLPVGNQQWLEILKQLFRNAKILILDEPTAVLAPSQVNQLFKIIRRLAAEGHAIIFISHKLDEVQQVTDRVTVLRDGSVVGTVDTAEATPSQMAQMMVGRPITIERKARLLCERKQVVLEVEAVNCNSDRGVPALRDLSLKVYAGEIVGVAGVDGNGQRELAEAIVGLRPINNGKIKIDGKEVTGVVKDTELVGYIPEDRRKTGLVLNFSVAENLIMKIVDRCAPKGILNWRLIHNDANDLIRTFNIKTPDSIVPVRVLSGGNQQRVVIARELKAEPSLLIASQPTRGLDVASVEAVHSILLQERNRGAAVLFISAELSEVMSLSDRIVVLYKGQIMGELDANTAEVQEIGELMLGMKRDRPAEALGGAAV